MFMYMYTYNAIYRTIWNSEKCICIYIYTHTKILWHTYQNIYLILRGPMKKVCGMPGVRGPCCEHGTTTVNAMIGFLQLLRHWWPWCALNVKLRYVRSTLPCCVKSDC
jgi:hypothetical protein